MDWEEAISEAKEELGYGQNEYIECWDEVVEMAKMIMDEYREEEYADFCDDARINYHNRLNSEAWKKLRRRVMERDGFRCCGCGSRAVVVHHKSYEHIDTIKEIDDCVSLCKECHKKRHSPNTISGHIEDHNCVL